MREGESSSISRNGNRKEHVEGAEPEREKKSGIGKYTPELAKFNSDENTRVENKNYQCCIEWRSDGLSKELEWADNVMECACEGDGG